jgi:inosine-uridine nucleoside N-ribohydrolase
MRQKQNTQYVERIIIDTDPGHDDALAILLSEKSDYIKIEAITTVAGNSTIQNVTNNARYILDLINSDAPIYSGSKKPLKRDLVLANVHGESGLDGANVIKKEKINNLAVSKIIEIITKNPKEISVLVIGPQTNIAKAIIREPKIAKLVKQFVIMGGAIECPGNKNRVAEFNIFVDPEAAEIIFNSGAEIILVPLDICNDVVLQEKDFQKITNKKISKPIMSMMKKYIIGIERFEKLKGALVYDALAAYYLINGNAYKTEKVDIRIETKGKLTRGMTVMDRRNWGDKIPNINLVTQIDTKKFIKDFIKIMNK